MRREAANAQIVQQLPHLLSLTLSPFEIGRIELDASIAHLSDGSNGGFRVLFQPVSNGIKLEPDWDGFGISGRKSPRQHRRKGKKGTAGQGWRWHCRMLLENWYFSTAFCESLLALMTSQSERTRSSPAVTPSAQQTSNCGLERSPSRSHTVRG